MYIYVHWVIFGTNFNQHKFLLVFSGDLRIQWSSWGTTNWVVHILEHLVKKCQKGNAYVSVKIIILKIFRVTWNSVLRNLIILVFTSRGKDTARKPPNHPFCVIFLTLILGSFFLESPIFCRTLRCICWPRPRGTLNEMQCYFVRVPLLGPGSSIRDLELYSGNLDLNTLVLSSAQTFCSCGRAKAFRIYTSKWITFD